MLDEKPRTLISWCQYGLIDPAIDSDGSGNHRQFNYENLFLFYLINGLKHYRFKLLKDIIKNDTFKALMNANKFTGCFVFDAIKKIGFYDKNIVECLNAIGESAVIINLTKIKERLDSDIICMAEKAQ